MFSMVGRNLNSVSILSNRLSSSLGGPWLRKVCPLGQAVSTPHRHATCTDSPPAFHACVQSSPTENLMRIYKLKSCNWPGTFPEPLHIYMARSGEELLWRWFCDFWVVCIAYMATCMHGRTNETAAPGHRIIRDCCTERTCTCATFQTICRKCTVLTGIFTGIPSWPYYVCLIYNYCMSRRT